MRSSSLTQKPSAINNHLQMKNISFSQQSLTGETNCSWGLVPCPAVDDQTNSITSLGVLCLTTSYQNIFFFLPYMSYAYILWLPVLCVYRTHACVHVCLCIYICFLSFVFFCLSVCSVLGSSFVFVLSYFILLFFFRCQKVGGEEDLWEAGRGEA